MSPALSAHLDLLRFLAALAVLLRHMEEDGFQLGWMPLAQLAHSAVVVFFVLSGFIIVASTRSRGLGARDYVLARASRIGSVALPAVAFCVLLALALAAASPDLARQVHGWRPPTLLEAASSLLFLNESWTVLTGTRELTLNPPYWSLCYEVWYYVLFGLFTFGRGVWRVAGLASAALLAGPAVLVLLPLWCLGAALASNLHRLPRLRPDLALLLLPLGPLVIVAVEPAQLDGLVMLELQRRLPVLWQLQDAQRFATDYLLGLAVVGHLWAFHALSPAVQRPWLRAQAPLQALAGFSFTLYLFHRPISALAGRLLPEAWRGAWASAFWAAGVLGLCWAISLLTEGQRKRWRGWLERAWQPR